MQFAMTGYQSGFQPKLFYHRINLEQRVPQDHILRKIEKRIDFDFIYAEVKNSYGDNGNVSVPPAVILKMMLLLILYNVRSERELINTIPLRLDWLWFLGYDLAKSGTTRKAKSENAKKRKSGTFAKKRDVRAERA
jgi:transposase